MYHQMLYIIQRIKIHLFVSIETLQAMASVVAKETVCAWIHDLSQETEDFRTPG